MLMISGSGFKWLVMGIFIFVRTVSYARRNSL